jgi:hypothetical protein
MPSNNDTTQRTFAGDTLHLSFPHPYYRVPSERPQNFAFRIGFPPHYVGDILDTFKGTFRRDLVDRDTTIPLTLSGEELDTIYDKMFAIDLFNYRNILTIGELRRTKCHKTFDIIVRADSVTVHISKIPCAGAFEQNVDAVQELSNLIAKIIHSKDEYRKLPEPQAGRL